MTNFSAARLIPISIAAMLILPAASFQLDGEKRTFSALAEDRSMDGQPSRGRLPDGRAFRTDTQGDKLVDYIAELEVGVETLTRQVQGLEDELAEKQRVIDGLGGAGLAKKLVERDIRPGEKRSSLPALPVSSVKCPATSWADCQSSVEAKELREKLEVAQRELGRLRAVGDASADTASLSSSNRELSKRASALEAELKERQSALDVAEQKLRRISQEHQSERAEIEEKARRIDVSRDDLERRADALQSELEERRKEVLDLRANTGSSSQVMGQLEAKVEACATQEREFGRLKGDRDRLEVELQKARLEASRRQSDDLRTRDEARTALGRKVESLEVQVKEKQTIADELSKERDSRSAELIASQESLARKQEALNRSSEEVQRAQAAADELSSRYEVRLAQSGGEIERLTARLAEVERDLASAREASIARDDMRASARIDTFVTASQEANGAAMRAKALESSRLDLGQSIRKLNMLVAARDKILSEYRAQAGSRAAQIKPSRLVSSRMQSIGFITSRLRVTNSSKELSALKDEIEEIRHKVQSDIVRIKGLSRG